MLGHPRLSERGKRKLRLRRGGIDPLLIAAILLLLLDEEAPAWFTCEMRTGEFSLPDGAVLVTGANSGIGAEIARYLALKGVPVAIHFLDREAPAPGEGHAVLGQRAAESLAGELRTAGATVEIFDCDLSDARSVSRLLPRAEATLGTVRGLVNNAAYCGTEDSIKTANFASFINHFSINVAAAAVLIRCFAEGIARSGQNGGAIVSLSTDSARAFPTQVFYGSSKAALESLTRSAAIELGCLGIRVNAIAPGPVQTGWMNAQLVDQIIPSIPLGRVGTPHDIAVVAAFLLGSSADWVTGQIIQVSGGHAL